MLSSADRDGPNRRQRAALAADDASAYRRESRRFHVGMLEPSRMARLLQMLESAWDVTEPVQLMGRLSRDMRAALLEDHEQILAAFLARDGETLVASSMTHSDRLRDAVLALPPDSGVSAPVGG